MQNETHKDCHCWYNISNFPPIKCTRPPLSVLINLTLLTNIKWKIYCRLGYGHFVVMVTKTPLSVVHLHIVKGFVKVPVHYWNCYVYFIATNIAAVNKGQLNVGCKYYLQHGTASVPIPASLWSLFPIETWIRNCVNKHKNCYRLVKWFLYCSPEEWIQFHWYVNWATDPSEQGFLLKLWN